MMCLGKQRLPPCPILILSTSDGVLQTYYFAHNNLSSICHSPEHSPKLAYESRKFTNELIVHHLSVDMIIINECSYIISARHEFFSDHQLSVR